MRMWKIIYTTQCNTNEQYAFTEHALDRVKALKRRGARVERVERLPYTVKNFYLCCQRKIFIK